MMQLKDLEHGDRFKIADMEDSPVITFSHLDGMYSYNTLDNGDVVHLRFNTPIERQDDDTR